MQIQFEYNIKQISMTYVWRSRKTMHIVQKCQCLFKPKMERVTIYLLKTIKIIPIVPLQLKLQHFKEDTRQKLRKEKIHFKDDSL